MLSRNEKLPWPCFNNIHPIPPKMYYSSPVFRIQTHTCEATLDNSGSPIEIPFVLLEISRERVFSSWLLSITKQHADLVIMSNRIKTSLFSNGTNSEGRASCLFGKVNPLRSFNAGYEFPVATAVEGNCNYLWLLSRREFHDLVNTIC